MCENHIAVDHSLFSSIYSHFRHWYIEFYRLKDFSRVYNFDRDFALSHIVRKLVNMRLSLNHMEVSRKIQLLFFPPFYLHKTTLIISMKKIILIEIFELTRNSKNSLQSEFISFNKNLGIIFQ